MSDCDVPRDIGQKIGQGVSRSSQKSAESLERDPESETSVDPDKYRGNATPDETTATPGAQVVSEALVAAEASRPPELPPKTATRPFELDMACTVIASAYQAVACLVLREPDKRPSEADEIRLLDMLSSWEEWSVEEIESFLPWPKEWQPDKTTAVRCPIFVDYGTVSERLRCKLSADHSGPHEYK